MIIKSKLCLLLLLLIIFNCCMTQKKYSVYNESNINDSYMKNMKFDIEAFNKNRQGRDSYKFIQNNMEIEQTKLKKIYVEYIKPIDKFYNIYNEYYLNGNLKVHGIRLNDGVSLGGLHIKTWEYYDEQGNLIRKVDEDARFGNVPFDYNRVILWLDKKGCINIKEGKTYTNFYSISFNSEKKYWQIDINDEYKIYLLDGKTGKIIGVGEINPIK